MDKYLDGRQIESVINSWTRRLDHLSEEQANNLVFLTDRQYDSIHDETYTDAEFEPDSSGATSDKVSKRYRQMLEKGESSEGQLVETHETATYDPEIDEYVTALYEKGAAELDENYIQSFITNQEEIESA